MNLSFISMTKKYFLFPKMKFLSCYKPCTPKDKKVQLCFGLRIRCVTIKKKTCSEAFTCGAYSEVLKFYKNYLQF